MPSGLDQPRPGPAVKAATQASVLRVAMLLLLATGMLGQTVSISAIVRGAFCLAAIAVGIIILILIRKAQIAGGIPTPPDTTLLKIARICFRIEISLAVSYVAVIAAALAIAGAPSNWAVVVLPGMILALAMLSTRSVMQKYQERIARSFQPLADGAENHRFQLRQRALSRRAIGALVGRTNRSIGP